MVGHAGGYGDGGGPRRCGGPQVAAVGGRYRGVDIPHPRSSRDAADDAALRDRRSQAVDALRPTLLVGALVLLGVAPVHLLLEPGRASLALGAVCGGLAVVFGAARASLARPRVRALVSRHPHEVLLGVCLLASVAAATELVAFGRPTSAGGMVVFLLAAGVLTTRRRDSLVVSAAVLVQWFAVAAAHGFADAWTPLSVLVVCAAVLAHVLQVVRSRATDDLARAEVMVLEAAVTDELTGLRNRRGLVLAGDSAARHRPDEPLSVLYMDVDGLKRTNDEHGHAAGDRLVRAAGAVLLREARAQDVVARIGGDEFAVLLPGTGADEARAAEERLARALAEAAVPASVGSATTEGRPGGCSVLALLEEADAAMYLDKQRRRAAPAAAAAAGRAGSTPAASSPEPAGGTTDQGLLAVPGAASTAALDLVAVARSAAWLHLGLAPVHLLVLPAGAGRLMAAASLLVAAACGLLLVRPLRAARARRAEDLMCALMVLLCAETVGYAAMVPERWASMATVLALVSAGGTLAGHRRVGLVCGVTTVAWLAVELRHGLDAQSPAYLIPVVSGVGVAVLVHLVHHRTLARLRAAEARVRAAAMTDELTGLPNRRAFLLTGRPLVELALRRGEQASVLLLDLDGLKRVNDVDGHAAGDRLLASAAEVLRRSVGPRDLLARLAGDEFTVLLHGCPPEDVAGRVAALEASLAAEGISASTGAAHLPRDARSLDGLVDRADEVMLRVKRSRRDAAARLAVPAG